MAGTGKGDTYLAEGEAALKRSTIFGFGKAQKYEDAGEAFKKAGNAYKLANLWLSAGDAFVKASDAYGSVVDLATDSSGMLVEAAQAYRKIDPLKAVQTYRLVIDRYNESGRFAMSARYAKEMAETFEADNNKEGAMVAYQEAANIFNSDNKKSNAQQCMQKVAEFAAEMGQLQQAAQFYEELGRDAMGSRLGQYSAKGHFLLCLLSHLALGDPVAVQQKFDAFKNVDFSFSTAREGEFIGKLLEATEQMDAELFSQHCADFDRITPLDPLKTSLLLKAKKFLGDAGGEDGEPDLS